MKNLKKVLAGLTALCMMASLASVAAFASSTEPASTETAPPAPPVIEYLEDATDSEVTGQGTVIFATPDNALSVLLPTSTAWNFILDPMGLYGEEIAGAIYVDDIAPTVTNTSPFPIAVNVEVKLTGDGFTALDEEDEEGVLEAFKDSDAASLLMYITSDVEPATGYVLGEAEKTLTYVLAGSEYTVSLDENNNVEFNKDEDDKGFSIEFGLGGICNPNGDWADFVPSDSENTEVEDVDILEEEAEEINSIDELIAVYEDGSEIFYQAGELIEEDEEEEEEEAIEAILVGDWDEVLEVISVEEIEAIFATKNPGDIGTDIILEQNLIFVNSASSEDALETVAEILEAYNGDGLWLYSPTLEEGNQFWLAVDGSDNVYTDNIDIENIFKLKDGVEYPLFLAGDVLQGGYTKTVVTSTPGQANSEIGISAVFTVSAAEVPQEAELGTGTVLGKYEKSAALVSDGGMTPYELPEEIIIPEYDAPEFALAFGGNMRNFNVVVTNPVESNKKFTAADIAGATVTAKNGATDISNFGGTIGFASDRIGFGQADDITTGAQAGVGGATWTEVVIDTDTIIITIVLGAANVGAYATADITVTWK